MIAKLTGIIDSVGSNYVIIDVNGVGYMVYASARTLSKIGSEKGTNVGLSIETYVREDQITLFGFADSDEKEWFNLLFSVQGVGAKMALNLLSAIPAEQLPLVIASEDKAAIRQADGVGPKLAARIITELKDKAGKMALGVAATQNAKKTKAGEAPAMSVTVSNDAISALINLGYGRAEAFSAVSDVVGKMGEETPVGEIIRESLKELSA